MGNNRNKLVDALKGYACFLVVLYHVLLGIENAYGVDQVPYISVFLTNFTGTYHVPLFMFLSGFVYHLNNDWKSKGSRIKFLQHKLINLGIPYVTFSVIYIMINSCMASSVNTAFGIENIFLLWKRPVAQYWFVFALFWLFVLFVLLSTVLKNWQITILLAVINWLSIFTNISLGILSSAISMALVFGVGTSISELYIDKLSKGKQGAIVIGHILFTSLMIIFNVEAVELSKIVGIAGSIALVSLLIHLECINKVLGKICKYSFPIYLLHTIFTAGIRVILMKIGINQYLIHVGMGLVFGFACPIVIAIIANKVKVFNVFFYPSKTIKHVRTINS